MTRNDEKLKKLLSNKPVNANLKKIEEWRKRVKKARSKSEKEYQKWVNRVEKQWADKEEWLKMRNKLMKLSLKQLRDLATKVGIKFSVGNEKIRNKEEFVLVLDEADKNELLKEYKKLL